jgi:hypothetical protein
MIQKRENKITGRKACTRTTAAAINQTRTSPRLKKAFLDSAGTASQSSGTVRYAIADIGYPLVNPPT